jgi:hypothetical protein
MRQLQIDHAYLEIPDTGHDARALLLRLMDVDAGFYTRVLSSVMKKGPP